MKYAFKVTSLIFVEASCEASAWNDLPSATVSTLADFKYVRSPEDDVAPDYIYVILKVGFYRADVLEQIYTSKEDAEKEAKRMKADCPTRHSFEVKRLIQKG